jgi:hypothetical protein
MKDEILDEKVLQEKGHMQRIRRWWRGIHPCRGVIMRGLTGWETMEERDRVLPAQTFIVGGEPGA